MVNYGVSKACQTCKARHIKCDETRPVCNRCTKSKRTCLGYNKDEDLLFRQYCRPSDADVLQVTPPQTPSPVAALPTDLAYQLQSPFEAQAVEAFFEDYVLKPDDLGLSRGYYNGLELLLLKSGWESELGRATKVVAFASFANRSGNAVHLDTARYMYSQVLSTFQQTLSNEKTCNSDEALVTASLLGLYEIITASEADPSAHGTHVRGISAILCTRNLPYRLLSGTGLFQSANPLLRDVPIPDTSDHPLLAAIRPPPSGSPAKDLDTILIEYGLLFKKTEALISQPGANVSDLRRLRQDAKRLKGEISLWPINQPPQWKPQLIGMVKYNGYMSEERLEENTAWPGRIYHYMDHYIAAVWDTYFKARLKILDVLAHLSRRLHKEPYPFEDTTTYRQIQSEAQEVANELAASVPYQTVADLNASLQQNSGQSIRPCKAVGGLMLMYPLYVAATLAVVPEEQRRWMKGRLRWIGKHMGVGQATMLANSTCDISHFAIASGHTLLFAGSLLQPIERTGIGLTYPNLTALLKMTNKQ